MHTTGNWTCPTCEREAALQFCAHCGEHRPERGHLSLTHVFEELVEGFLHLDGRLAASFRALLARPGQLTADALRGKRRPFVSPFQVFLTANLVFFLVQPLTGLNILSPPFRFHLEHSYYSALARSAADQRIHALGVPEEAFAERFNHTQQLQARTLLIVMVPFLTLITAALQVRRRFFLVEHGTFALHLYAFWLVWLAVSLAFWAIVFRLTGLRQMPWFPMDDVITTMEFGGLWVYAALALRRVYDDGFVVGAAKAAVLTFCVFWLLWAYRGMLFFTSLYAA